MFTHQIGDSLLPRNNRVIKCLPKEFFNFIISNILASCFCCTTLRTFIKNICITYLKIKICFPITCSCFIPVKLQSLNVTYKV